MEALVRAERTRRDDEAIRIEASQRLGDFQARVQMREADEARDEEAERMRQDEAEKGRKALRKVFGAALASKIDPLVNYEITTLASVKQGAPRRQRLGGRLRR